MLDLLVKERFDSDFSQSRRRILHRFTSLSTTFAISFFFPASPPPGREGRTIIRIRSRLARGFEKFFFRTPHRQFTVTQPTPETVACRSVQQANRRVRLETSASAIDLLKNLRSCDPVGHSANPSTACQLRHSFGSHHPLQLASRHPSPPTACEGGAIIGIRITDARGKNR